MFTRNIIIFIHTYVTLEYILKNFLSRKSNLGIDDQGLYFVIGKMFKWVHMILKTYSNTWRLAMIKPSRQISPLQIYLVFISFILLDCQVGIHLTKFFPFHWCHFYLLDVFQSNKGGKSFVVDVSCCWRKAFRWIWYLLGAGSCTCKL